MASRVQYLKFLHTNKDAFISDLATLNPNNESLNHSSGNEARSKMNQLLMLADDPKNYFRAMMDLQNDQQDKALSLGLKIKEDHLFEDKYIISDKTVQQQHQQRMQEQKHLHQHNLVINNHKY